MATTNDDRADHFDPAGIPPDVDPLTAPVGERFVIQQHHATALHHDFRLEMINRETPVLVSWAIPKGLPMRKRLRHLAIRTPDHSMDHATFEGRIPEDEYGGGVVRIFDDGAYEMIDRSDDRITFRLHGERLAGVWHLISTGTDRGKEQWLAVLSEDSRPPPDDMPPADPMLATLTGKAFDDPDWVFEPKWDGIRAIAICEDETRLISRNDRDISVAYPELSGLHRFVIATNAMLDGEIVAFENGVPSFQKLQQRMHVRDSRRIEEMAKRIPVAYIVFDVLYADGRDLTGLPLEERRRILDDLIVPTQTLQLSPETPGDGIALFSAAAKQGLEGIMAKKKGSTYKTGARSKDWLKVKVTFDADVIIVGWTEGEGNRAGTLGSLVMAVLDGDHLRYVGNVGTGFDRSSLEDAQQRLDSLVTPDAPFPVDVTRSRTELRKANWVEPVLVATVEHRQLTSAGRLRVPVFKGFREDKTPAQCTWDQLVTEASV